MAEVVSEIVNLMNKIDATQGELFKMEYLKKEAHFQKKGIHLLCKECGHFSMTKKESEEHISECPQK